MGIGKAIGKVAKEITKSPVQRATAEKPNQKDLKGGIAKRATKGK